jgi:hypothetical protein
LNLHNVKNDFKWKNKKLSQPLEIQLIFNPIVEKDYDSTSVLAYYFKKDDRIADIESSLNKKLSNRNFKLTATPSKTSLRIDSLQFADKVEMVSVSSNDGTEVLGDYEQNLITLKITGILNLKDSIRTRISTQYTFVDEPRESYVVKGSIAYSNSWVSIEKVMNNIINAYSYKCYQEVQAP